MMTTYSPHRENGTSVHLTSPSHLAHFDPRSAIHEIRRSLSRSPSKPSELRQYSFRPLSPCRSALPFSPSPLSPSRRSNLDHTTHTTSMAPIPTNRGNQNTRFHRPTLRRSAHTHSSVRIRTSPKSPSKKALLDSSDGGNGSPIVQRKRSSTEADRPSTFEDVSYSEEKENHHFHFEDTAMTTKPAMTRQEKRRSAGSLMSLLAPVAPLSPLKRSDAPMSLDQKDFSSPSAKRRSLHGPGLDFSIFESDSLGGNDSRSQDDHDWFRSGGIHSSARFSTIPRRSSSLRKSTLQQRHPKLGQIADIVPSWAEAMSTPNARQTYRPSLDGHLASLRGENLFSGTESPSTTTTQTTFLEPNTQLQPTRHPLSHSLVQSPSPSDVQDESPTHEPFHRAEKFHTHDFSRSLPIGASRPSPQPESEFSSQGSFATPGNYKFAKPLPAAFLSTGLISKKNRNAEDPDAGLSKAHMPDTPCKRQSIVFPTENQYPSVRPGPHRASRQSFGTPATPLDLGNGLTKPAIFSFAKSVGLFGPRSNNKQGLTRKASFASIDGDDKALSQSPTGRGDSQSTDNDYPPTPTKHITEEAQRNASISPSPHYPRMLSTNNVVPTSTHGLRFTSSKLSSIQASPRSVDGDSDSIMEESPSANLRLKSSLTAVSMPTSFSRARNLRHLNSPTPLSRKALALPNISLSALERTKMSSLSPVSPRLSKSDRISPHTPQDGFFPPDPSGLSISGKAEPQFHRRGSAQSLIFPATPTGPREYFPNFSNRPSLNLVSGDDLETDQSLQSRFDKVDLVGTGEFSQVYRVSQPAEKSPYHKVYTVSTARPASSTSIPDRVWAVKKSRHPYAGTKDRQRKIHEVDVWKALGHSDHIVAFADSWEEDNHLYIQTEFCEEGTLELFLAQVGLKARLDDFRIWKILLELSLGLKHIHDAGFIHLDLKPANILITFEGSLKIADFGMATKWPAKAGIEGEGDREYIGPEILMGKYDKPADIFALGLIMLETAGNVALPDNGVSWQKLRNGDMSDVPSLTWTSAESIVLRDSSGNPIPDENSFECAGDPSEEGIEVIECDQDISPRTKLTQPTAITVIRSGELLCPPQFMVDPQNSQALDHIVRWMISPDPADRPLVSEVLGTDGAVFAATRRRAGATIYEGNWGPADEVLAEDAEMIDV